MKLRILLFTCIITAIVALPALAVPISGTYTSTDLGGQLLTGRASTWRSGVNSGLPHVLHAQSWNGSTLGTQWEINCPIEPTNFTVQDNRIGGVGTVVYTSFFNGGTFTFFAGGWPWGDGTGTLGTTTVISTVQYLMISGNSTPVASVVNTNTSGLFAGGCTLTFAIANGNGVGETPTPASRPTTRCFSMGPATRPRPVRSSARGAPSSPSP